MSGKELPKIDLTTFFLSVSSAAYMNLGVSPDETKYKAEINLDLARQNIDLIELIEEKTRGNRTKEEDQLVERLLFEMRMRFVDVERNSK